MARGDLGAELPIEEVPLLQVRAFSWIICINLVSSRMIFCLPLEAILFFDYNIRLK